MSELKTYLLEDVVEKLIDYRGKTPVKTESGIPLITAKVIKNGRIETPTEFIADADYESWMTRGIPEIGDVVLTTEAPLGEVAQINTKDKIALAQRVITLRGKENVLDSTYLKYFLYSPIGQGNLKAKETGSTVTGIKQSELRKVEIYAPDFETQQEIAQILTSLDDKIELNLQMNQTLEATAQALFKEWFVNFNFPNFDGELENGLPKGWRMGKVGEILQPKRGRNITKAEAIEGVFPVVAGGLEPSCYHNESNTQEPVITISSSGANAGFVRLYQMPVWSADSCFIDSSIFPFVYYIYIFLKSNQKNIYDSQEGSAQPHIYPRHIMDLNICVGNESVVQQFEEIVTPLFEKIKYNSLQIQNLTETRDTLLPKLMSGKIEIKKQF